MTKGINLMLLRLAYSKLNVIVCAASSSTSSSGARTHSRELEVTTEVTEEALTPGVYPLFDETLTDWAMHESDIDWCVEAFSLGPVWDKNPDWDGPRDPQGYILPKLTIGWQAIRWVHENLLADETDEFDNRLPQKLPALRRRSRGKP